VFVFTFMRVTNHAGLTPTQLEEIEMELSGQQTLADVVKWASKQPTGMAPGIITRVVIQDEFTHDVLVPWGERLVLVYAAT